MVVLAVCAAYGLSAALRLAKFNITTAVDDPRFFRGLPSTSSGGILAAAYLAHRELSLGEGAAIGLLAWMVVNAVLMVSNLPQPKVGSTRSAPAKYLQLAIFLCAYTMIPLRRFPVFILFVATAVSLGGFVFGVLVKRREGDSGGDPTPGAPALSK
jgi:phosphatidylserine synthase